MTRTSPFRSQFDALEISGIAKIASQALDDPDVIPLWFGEGDLPTGSPMLEHAKQALDEGQTFYSYPRGRTALRQALVDYHRRIYGIDLHPDRVHVPGSTMLSITIAVHSVTKPGDHGLIVSPNWPNVAMVFDAHGVDYDYVRQDLIDDCWTLDIDKVKAACRANTRMIFCNSPCNPTGWILAADQQSELLAFCRQRGIVLLADEVYHRNIFEGEVAPSFLSLATDDDPVIVVNGFSKAWAMTGWRLGWMVTPKGFAEQFAVMAEIYNTGATAFTQFGGVAALRDGEAVVAELRQLYATNRALVLDLLGRHPRVELAPPSGAFYAFPRIDGITSSLAFANRALHEKKVGVAPGYTFGPDNEAFIRICFAISTPRLEQALTRIVALLGQR